MVGLVDKKGPFSLYVPDGRCGVQVMSVDYSPFPVEGLERHSGPRSQLDGFLHVSLSSSSRGTCIYKSKRKLSVAE